MPPGIRIADISDTRVHNDYLSAGRLLPDWLKRPEVAEILGESDPPRHKQGACIWFTGLSGAGKSTTAEVLTQLLLQYGRRVTVLDGDVVRTHLSKGLGFSQEDRDINVRRIGFVAAGISTTTALWCLRPGVPTEATRDDVRAMVGSGHFVEVFVDTPIEVCEQRDGKGMYAKARRGEIKGFTGTDDPYETPLRADIRLDTVVHTAEENASLIVDYLVKDGLLRVSSSLSQPVFREGDW